MKILILIMILFSAIALNISPAKSQSIRTIQADTIFKGYESGETKSVKIINHGTNIIYNHSGKLYEMNAYTYRHIRVIPLAEVKPVTKFSIDVNCKYIIYNTDSTDKTFVADYNTGKTLKVIRGRYYLGDKFIYTTNCSKCPVVSIIKYNLSNLTPNDTFLLPLKSYSGFIPEFKNITSIPNSDNIIVSTGGTLNTNGILDAIYSYNIVDFKIDSIRHIALHQSSNAEGSAYSYLLISEDLKYNILEKSEYYTTEDTDRKHITKYVDTDFFIHDAKYKYVDYIKESEIRKLLKDPELKFHFNGIIVKNRYLVFGISRKIQAKSKNQIMVYDLDNDIPFALIDFDVNAFSYNGKFIFSNRLGCLATLTLEQVPVQENNKLSNEYSVSYSNNNLLILSDAAQQLNISIMNITGEEVESINNIYLTEGSNTIPMNNQLANGLYFCIFKTAENSISRKFMVIK